MIWLLPVVWISGSETPSWSTRERMMSTARFSDAWVTTGLCGRRLALVDELDPALEVESQDRPLGGDHDHRGGDQAHHEEQDEAVTLAI